MHISEGILPLQLAAGTTAVTIPFVAKGVQSIKQRVDRDPSVKPLIGLVSAAVFVISALPLPAPTGTSAHPTAIAIAAIILGPWAAAAVTGVVLMMQALFMAHGGISAWGANTMNMGIFGAFLAYGTYHLARRLNAPLWLSLGLAGALGDLITYLMTSATMALALAGDRSILTVTVAIFAAFLPSLAVLLPLEVLFTVGLFSFVRERRPDLAERMGMTGTGVGQAPSSGRMTGSTWLTLAGVFLVGLVVVALFIPSQWEGVDVAVVQAKAQELGGTVSAPLLNITGDLQLFVFTMAGFIGGAIVGYTWRGMFGQGSSSTHGGGPGEPIPVSESDHAGNATFSAVALQPDVPAASTVKKGVAAEHSHEGGHKHQHDEIAEIAQDDELVMEREQALGGVSARAKVIALAGALIVNMVAPSWITPFALFVASVALLARAGVPRHTLITRLMVPWYFAAVAFLTQVFFVGHTVVLEIGPAVVYSEGLLRGVQIASRILGGTAAVLLVSMTTPMTGLLATATWLRVPPVLVEIATLTYRYLFLLGEEVERVREAQKTRLGHGTWRNSIRSYGTLGGMVMVGAYDRADRVYQSMVLRGYKGELPIPEAERSFSPSDGRALALAAVGLVAALALGLAI
ncbi:MAG: energy-coupling factor ABC transporter permease [Dehalococcoidales bacterium]|nr:energy-coupling factor ABC transporter permease [Dehalococcoidales bacterium]